MQEMDIFGEELPSDLHVDVATAYWFSSSNAYAFFVSACNFLRMAVFFHYLKR
jgi:hypothetical protein